MRRRKITKSFDWLKICLLMQIFKLSQGEYIAPERVENAYKTSPLLSQLFVYGSSTESYLLGVAVPEEAEFMSAAQEAGFKGGFEELIRQPQVHDWLLEELSVFGKAVGLKVCMMPLL